MPPLPGGTEMFDKTVMMFFLLFSDIAPELAESVSRDPARQQKRIAEGHIIDIVRSHFFEELKPPVVWNFNYIVQVVPRTPAGQRSVMCFWDSGTKQIADKAKYLQICYEMRSEWKEGLVQACPYYDRDKLEDGFESTFFDYYPDEGMIAITLLLEKFLPLR